MRYLIAIALALSSAACSQNGTITETVLPSPTAVIATVNAVCNTQITALNFDVDYSGPNLIIDISFASAPSPVEIEIERYLPNGGTDPVAQVSDVVGRTRIGLNFNTKYRGRARAGTCPWTPWFDQQIGPPNPCGSCTAPPPPPPPPPPQECNNNEPLLPLAWSSLKGIMVETPPPPQECQPPA